jgi:arylsulfatase A-like enzyme
VSWPGHIPQGAVRDQMASSMDWFPTLAQYCRVPLPEVRIDGKNIAPLIASPDTASPHETLHWAHGAQWAVREGPWKLVYNGPESVFEEEILPKVEYFLSHLGEDPGERENLANQYPERVKRLTQLHEQWAKDVVQQ